MGVLRDHRRRAGRPAVGRRHERRAHRDDQHARHAGRGARARASRCGCAATGCGGAAAAPGAHPGGDGIWRELEVLAPTDGVARSPSAGRRRRRGSPAARPARWARTGCCPAATRRGRGGCPTSAPCTSRPATCCGSSPRAAGAGDVSDRLLTSATTSGAASAMPGWNSRDARSTVSTWSARSSMRRRPLRHALQPLGHEPRVRGSARGSSDEPIICSRSTHTSRDVGGRQRARARRRRCHRVEHDARVTCRPRRVARRARPSSSISTPACEHARAGPESTPASTSASRSPGSRDRNHSDSWNTASHAWWNATPRPARPSGG